MRRVRYYLGRCEDALDDATSALHQTPAVDAGLAYTVPGRGTFVSPR